MFASKFVLLAIFVGIVWIGFRYKSRVDAIRRAVREELQRRQTAPRRPPIEVEDLVKCAQCGAYVAAQGAAPCGRGECPWRR
jgi:uncharacterized protein